VAIGICVQTDSRFLDVNASYLTMTGYAREEILGHSASELGLWARPEQREQLVEALQRQGMVTNFEVQIKTKHGRVLDVLTSVEPMQLGLEPCWLFIDMDITSHKSLESQVRQTAKMESIGTLAGGVAHDFNNLLTVIQGHTDMLGMQGGLPVDARSSLQQIAAATERAANLTRQLLTFSRKHPIQLSPVDLNDTLSNLTRMLQRIIGEDIVLEVVQAPRLPAILADAGMIEQVIFNLAANARDSMPQGGKLTFETRLANRAAGEGTSPGAKRAGPCVELVVRDCGCGIPAADQPRIFEPFFTTKDVGKGTGLGLASVHGILEQHRGWIEFESQVGVGTTFHIFLPACQLEAQAAGTHPAVNKVRGGAETILLVEDEPEVRSLARDLLQLYGYQVLEAGSGVEALKVWKDNQLHIDLVLTDVIMPHGMNGVELARKLREERPELKIIFSSGYASPKGAVEEMTARDRHYYLQKPYAPSHLAQMVRDILDV
jgi:PAS domain S-box-containing protein